MKKHFILLLLLTIQMQIFASVSIKKILFVGNSITSYNSMPYIFQKIAKSMGDSVFIQNIAVDGMRLRNYLIKDQFNVNRFISIADTIKIGKFDFVIIQDAVTEILKPAEKIENFDFAIAKIDSICKLSGSKLVVFKSYIIPSFPAIYCGRSMQALGVQCSRQYDKPSDVFNIITHEFDLLKKKYSILISPICDAFMLCRTMFHNIKLYSDYEDYHPSLEGSYLIACVHYRCCFEKKIRSNAYFGLKKSNALHLQNIANKINY